MKDEIKLLRAALAMALYHDGWMDEEGNPKTIHNKLKAPEWVKRGFEALRVSEGESKSVPIQNKCNVCGKDVNNNVFTVCDDCWDKEVGPPKAK